MIYGKYYSVETGQSITCILLVSQQKNSGHAQPVNARASALTQSLVPVKNKKCLCISLENEEHDTSAFHIRKPFALHLNTDKHANTTKTFLTDGSGSKLNRESNVMLTGWAAVEVKLQVTQNKQELELQKLGSITSLSPNYESVQWCESRAILEAIRMAEPNCNIHIHTDSLASF